MNIKELFKEKYGYEINLGITSWGKDLKNLLDEIFKSSVNDMMSENKWFNEAKELEKENRELKEKLGEAIDVIMPFADKEGESFPNHARRFLDSLKEKEGE